MTFTSIGFAPFLLGVVVLSLVAGTRYRWLVLLAASYLFYASFRAPYLLAVLAAVTLVAHSCARAIARSESDRAKRAILWLGIAVAIAAIAGLRYGGLLLGSPGPSGAGAVPTGARVARGLVTVGVAYYTLQAISYLLDVRDEVLAPEPHLGHFALYLAFFPRLVQGPIERAENLLPQLRQPARLSARDAGAAAQLFLWGLFQKVVVADRLAPFVDAVYGDVHRHPGLPLIVATYLFAAQLYFDFAGYTDMALAVGRLFGVRLTQNFDLPYRSRSVAEFWRRWHISFSSWLLDYVFRPLQLQLRGLPTWGTPLALLATFLVSGVWHGASWCFVLWGLLHGLYLSTSALYRPWQRKLHKALPATGSRLWAALQIAVTFHLVCLAWIFFRASSVGDAFWAVVHLFSGMPETLARLARGEDWNALVYLGQGRSAFGFAVALLALGTLLRAYLRDVGVCPGATPAPRSRPWGASWARTVVYAAMFYLIAIFGTATQSFIYEQF